MDGNMLPDGTALIPVNDLAEVPAFANEDEEHAFWSTHCLGQPLLDQMQPRRKRAIVTGASRGIGRAVTEMLLAEGWAVIGVSRHPFSFPPSSCGHGFTPVPLDLSEPIDDRLNPPALPIDALIHCAAVRSYGPLAESEPDDWIRIVETNLIGTYRVIRAVLPRLRESEDGRILLFSGGGAFDPSAGFSAYGCSKAGVVALAETLAEELQSTTVTVNAIAPGFVATGIHVGTPYEGKSDGGEAMGRAVACIRHMLSPATKGVTGKTISAVWDDWQSIDQLVVDELNESEMGTRTRRPVQRVRELLRQRVRRMA